MSYFQRRGRENLFHHLVFMLPLRGCHICHNNIGASFFGGCCIIYWTRVNYSKNKLHFVIERMSVLLEKDKNDSVTLVVGV